MGILDKKSDIEYNLIIFSKFIKSLSYFKVDGVVIKGTPSKLTYMMKAKELMRMRKDILNGEEILYDSNFSCVKISKKEYKKFLKKREKEYNKELCFLLSI